MRLNRASYIPPCVAHPNDLARPVKYGWGHRQTYGHRAAAANGLPSPGMGAISIPNGQVTHSALVAQTA